MIGFSMSVCGPHSMAQVPQWPQRWQRENENENQVRNSEIVVNPVKVDRVVPILSVTVLNTLLES